MLKVIKIDGEKVKCYRAPANLVLITACYPYASN